MHLNIYIAFAACLYLVLYIPFKKQFFKMMNFDNWKNTPLREKVNFIRGYSVMIVLFVGIIAFFITHASSV